MHWNSPCSSYARTLADCCFSQNITTHPTQRTCPINDVLNQLMTSWLQHMLTYFNKHEFLHFRVQREQGKTKNQIVHSMVYPEELLALPYLTPSYDDPEFSVHNIWRQYAGWWDQNPCAYTDSHLFQSTRNAQCVYSSWSVDDLCKLDLNGFTYAKYVFQHGWTSTIFNAAFLWCTSSTTLLKYDACI